MHSILLAAPITAKAAMELGLVSELADDDVVQRAVGVACGFTRSNSEAVKLAKKAICAGKDGFSFYLRA